MNKQYFFSVLFSVFFLVDKSQIITNGNFTSGTTSWACSPETNPESVYGGSGSNSVAEVDAAAGLCQTVVTLGVGNMYTLSYDCSRRTGGCPSPNPTNMNITVSGGALTKTDVRSNSTFGWTTTSYNFTALSTSHTITFAAGSGFGGSTCGMIVDNISVTLFSALPIELLYFNVSNENDKSVTTKWETASETNNDFFTLEKSKNSIDWESVAVLDGAGNSIQRLTYSYIDNNPYSGTSYYRLKQTDFNGTFKYASIQSVEINKASPISIYPNPSMDHKLKITTGSDFPYNVDLYNNLGEIMYESHNHVTDDLNFDEIAPGIYYLSISKNEETVYRNIIVLQ